MTRFSLVGLGLGATLLGATLLGACAPKVPDELTQARAAYGRASAGPALTLVPAELHKARGALADAELAFEEDPNGYHTLDLAYVALRKAELAEARAAVATEQRSAKASDAQYQATQGAILKGTQAELGSTQSSLAATQSVVTQTAAELETTRASLAASELRGREALAALAKLAAVKEEPRGVVITLSGSVLFRSDESTLLPAAQARLGQVSDALLALPDRELLVEGHTDSQGSDPHNLDLSQRRADAVRTFLTERGYAPARIRAVGIGETRPVADNGTAEGRANNRRVEIVISPSASASK